MTKHEDSLTTRLWRRALMLALCVAAGPMWGAGCSDSDLFIECSRNDECDEEQVCLNQICQSPQCDTEEIVCGRQCVNPRITLEFCGGCGGCPQVAGADAVQCVEGQCVYQCQEGLVDTNGDVDLVNGDGCECDPEDTEVCDGRDNDCDGLVDGADDDLMACPSEPRSQAQCVDGVCELACEVGFADVNGDLGSGADGCECEQDGPEVCDGVDNDCDGLVDREDEDLEVAQEVCDGVDNDCDGLVDTEDEDLVVNPEVCDGVDNDCDGDIDGRDHDFVAPDCALNQGVCAGLEAQCSGGESLECSVVDYALHASGLGQRFQSDETICDEQDNDCDGVVDELCCGLNPTGDGIIEGDRFLSLQAVVVREDGTQAALLINDGEQYSVVLVEERGVEDARVDGLADVEFGIGNGATLHRDDSTGQYVFIQHRPNRILVREISDTATLGVLDVIPTGQELNQIKVVPFDDGSFVIIGENNLKDLVFIRVAGGAISGQDVLSRADIGGWVRRIDFAGRRGDDMIVTAEISEENSNTALERELAVLTVDVSGLVPRPLVGSIVRYSKDSINELGYQSQGSFVDGDTLYRLVQQDNLINVVRQDLTRGLAGVEEVIFSVDNREVDLDAVFQLDDRLMLDVEVDDAGSVVVFSEDDERLTSVRPSSLEGIEFASKFIVPHPLGAFVFWGLSEGIFPDDTARIEVSIVNRFGQPLCPWNP